MDEQEIILTGPGIDNAIPDVADNANMDQNVQVVTEQDEIDDRDGNFIEGKLLFDEIDGQGILGILDNETHIRFKNTVHNYIAEAVKIFAEEKQHDAIHAINSNIENNKSGNLCAEMQKHTKIESVINASIRDNNNFNDLGTELQKCTTNTQDNKNCVFSEGDLY